MRPGRVDRIAAVEPPARKVFPVPPGNEPDDAGNAPGERVQVALLPRRVPAGRLPGRVVLAVAGVIVIGDEPYPLARQPLRHFADQVAPGRPAGQNLLQRRAGQRQVLLRVRQREDAVPRARLLQAAHKPRRVESLHGLRIGRPRAVLRGGVRRPVYAHAHARLHPVHACFLLKNPDCPRKRTVGIVVSFSLRNPQAAQPATFRDLISVVGAPMLCIISRSLPTASMSLSIWKKLPATVIWLTASATLPSRMT